MKSILSIVVVALLLTTIPLFSADENGIFATIGDEAVSLSQTEVTGGGYGMPSIRRRSAIAYSTLTGATSTRRVASDTTFKFTGQQFNPTNFVLIKLKSENDKRKANTGKTGFGARNSFEVDRDALIETVVTRTDDGSYVVKPVEELPAGEYAFVPKRFEPDWMYDFGVDQ